MSMNKYETLTVPQLGVNDSIATLVSWKVLDGDFCEAGQVVCEIETTKAIQEVQAHRSGYLFQLIQEKQELLVGQSIAIIGEDTKVLSAQSAKIKSEREKNDDQDFGLVVTVKAKKLADSLGLTIEELQKEINASQKVIKEADVKMAHQRKLSKNQVIPENFGLSLTDRSVVIYGAGAGAATMKEAIDLRREFEVACFIDDNPRAAEHCGLPVFHSKQLIDLKNLGLTYIATEISISSVRLNILNLADDLGMTLINVIHPNAFVAPSAKLGKGLFIKAGAVVETNSTVGDVCIIDNGVILAHDANIQRGVHLAPGVSTGGFVNIGEFTVVGVGSSIATGAEVGASCIIAPGSSITRSIPENSLVEGVPAKIIGQAKNR